MSPLELRWNYICRKLSDSGTFCKWTAVECDDADRHYVIERFVRFEFPSYDIFASLRDFSKCVVGNRELIKLFYITVIRLESFTRQIDMFY